MTTPTLDKSLADFSGWATKANLKCSDGRTIMPDAFQHMDGVVVPLVWAHDHKNPENVLGHALLEARPEGVYTYAWFNNTAPAQHAKGVVEHKDIKSLSIWANNLVERAKQVFHGKIREVSLVISGANPGAVIENVQIAHGEDDYEILSDEAIITTGEEIVLRHEYSGSDNVGSENDNDDEGEGDLSHATVKEVLEGFSEEEMDVVTYLVAEALASAKEKSAEHSEESSEEDAGSNSEDNNDEGNLEHKEGNDDMGQKTNVFESGTESDSKRVLSHAEVGEIMHGMEELGTLRASMKAFAEKHLEHGINDINTLFPEAKDLTNRPEWDKRDTEWVAGVLNAARKTPFTRIRTRTADLTFDDARAKGYITGNMKKEEWFSLAQRVTTPTTVYKKQGLERDDMLDITDFDVVAWMWEEMLFMLKEELARAMLVGDGRDVADPDKVKDPAGAAEGAGIRSIYKDHEAYVTDVFVNLDDANSTYMELVEGVLRARRFYKGSGSPTFYTTEEHLTEMLLLRDDMGRRHFRTVQDLASEMRVSNVVTVEVLEDEAYSDLLGVIVNFNDYAIGTDKGGEIARFDDFDIDYNKYKYLIETRLSGALVKLKSAMRVKRVAQASTLATPVKPAYDFATNTITIPTTTGVDYQIDGVTQVAGDVVITENTKVIPVAQSGYHLANSGVVYRYTFNRDA